MQSAAIGSLRPRERVRAYLSAEFERPDLQAGSRLPTMRQLASQLSVSVPTVQSVFQELARAGRIRTQLGNGTFLVSAPRQSPATTFRIALNIPMLHSVPMADWGTRILQELLRAAARDPRPVMIMPLEAANRDPGEVAEELMEERSRVDALLVFPHFQSQLDRVADAYAQERKPVVFINPPAVTANVNFVSTDFFAACLRLGRVWRETGRKRVLYVCGPLEDSISAQLMCQGLVTGLDPHARSGIDFQIARVADVSEAAGYAAMAEMARESRTLPDAVYCFGDALALGVTRALRERGRVVPDDVSVVGGTGIDLTGTALPQLTRIQQPYRDLGEALVAMVCARIEQQAISLPGVYLPTSFCGGMTTRAAENAALGMVR